LCRAKFCNMARAHDDIGRIYQRIRITKSVAGDIRRRALELIELRVAEDTAKRESGTEVINDVFEREMRLTEAFTSGSVSPEIYKKQIEQFRERRKKAEAFSERPKLSRESLVTHVEEILRVATSVEDLRGQLPARHQADVVRAVFKTIILGSDGIVGFVLQSPFDKLSALKAASVGVASQQRDEAANAILTAP